MYDFNFETKQNIKKKPEDFLIFVKRLLPRWANGIPDSECVAIFKVLKLLRQKKKKKLILLETGSGASTLAMFLHCALFGGKMYSWDTNASKGSFLRSVISDSIGKKLKVDVNKIWNFIPFNSTDPNVGIRVLKELKRKADFCFFDSWHTLDHIMFELREFEKVSTARFVVAFDDAYYTKKHSNYSYINMLRAKLNLKKVKETYDLMSQKFFTHATPTLFNAGTPRPQLSSCYLIAMESDSIKGIYNTLSDCAAISKWAGGIGLHIHNIRAAGSHIRGTNGTSNGIVPMLRVFNNTARYVDQGGGKRQGSFAIYLEP